MNQWNPPGMKTSRIRISHYSTKTRFRKDPKKLGRYFYRNAIESAFRNNQRAAVDLIIKYIVKYQNDFISNWLFSYGKNPLLPTLIEAGVKVEALLQS
jgi:hypothetical protein